MTLEELVIKITADTSGLDSDLGGAESKISALGVAAGAAVAAVTAAVVKVGEAALESYAQYEQLVGGVDKIFGESSETIQEYAQQAYKTAGVSANQYMEQVTSFSSALIQSTAGDTAEAAEVANMALIDMADNANTFGTDMTAIQNAYQGFAKQNYTMLDNLKLGYGGTKTEMERLLADAQELSGVEYDISNLADVYNAIHVIQEELNVTGTTAKEASTTISGSFNSMQAAWDNMLTSLLSDNENALQESVNNLVDSAMQFLENIIPLIPVFFEGLLTAIQTAADTLLPQIIQVINDMLPGILQTIVALVPPLLDTIIDQLPLLIQTIVDMLPDILSAIIEIITGIVEKLPEFIAKLIPMIPKIIVALAEALVENIPTLLSAVVKTVEEIIASVFTAIGGLFDGLPDIFTKLIDMFVNFGSNLAEGVSSIFEGIKDIVTSIFEALLTVLKTPINAIIGVINGMVSGIVSGMNAVINALNKLSFDIPDWVPVLGGKTFGFNLKNITAPQIPYLASGGVVDEPTVAMVGEYAGASNNPEIVAPQSVLQSIVSQGNSELASVYLQVGRQIIQAIEQQDLSVKIGNDVIANSAAQGNRDYYKRTGKSIFAI